MTVLKWRCSPTQHRIQALASVSHVLTWSSGPRRGDCTLAQAWPSPPGWPGEPLALPSYPLGLSTTPGPGPRAGGSGGTHAGPRDGRGDREEVKRFRSPFWALISVKSFKALTLIGIPHQNMAIIVSTPNKIQKCHIRQKRAPRAVTGNSEPHP